MHLLDRITRRILWRPKGHLASLANLSGSHGLMAKWDVTPMVSGQAHGHHPLTVVKLADAKVIGNLRLIATRDDLVVGGLQTIAGCANPGDHYALKRRRLRIPKYRRGTAFLLGASNDDNYYHWLMDSLPRWQMLQVLRATPCDFVLLPEKSLPFQEDTLDRLGVSPAKRLRCSGNFVHQFEHLIVPAMPSPVFAAAPWACAWVRSLFPEKSSGPEKLYLSRGRGGRRRLVNEEDLENALRARGFVTVQTGRLTVAEQARLFASARWVVAPHGAALTNLIFAPPGALLLELFHPRHKNLCYVNLAAACGHEYASLGGQTVVSSNARQLAYSVDIAAVLRKLDQQD